MENVFSKLFHRVSSILSQRFYRFFIPSESSLFFSRWFTFWRTLILFAGRSTFCMSKRCPIEPPYRNFKIWTLNVTHRPANNFTLPLARWIFSDKVKGEFRTGVSCCRNRLLSRSTPMPPQHITSHLSPIETKWKYVDYFLSSTSSSSFHTLPAIFIWGFGLLRK